MGQEVGDRVIGDHTTDVSGSRMDSTLVQSLKNGVVDEVVNNHVHEEGVEHSMQDMLVITEQKRRRVVLAESDVNELMHEEQVPETLEEDPKNLEKAGLGLQARLVQ